MTLDEMKRVKQRFDSIAFDAFYGYIKTQNLERDVKKILDESMTRYLEKE